MLTPKMFSVQIFHMKDMGVNLDLSNLGKLGQKITGHILVIKIIFHLVFHALIVGQKTIF